MLLVHTFEHDAYLEVHHGPPPYLVIVPLPSSVQ